jgi:hypothetical protein
MINYRRKYDLKEIDGSNIGIVLLLNVALERVLCMVGKISLLQKICG